MNNRKDRTKRLCKRMGLFESMLPDTITLTDEQFQIFLEKTIITEHSHRILDRLTAHNIQTTVPESTNTAPQNTAGSSENLGKGKGVLCLSVQKYEITYKNN